MLSFCASWVVVIGLVLARTESVQSIIAVRNFIAGVVTTFGVAAVLLIAVAIAVSWCGLCQAVLRAGLSWLLMACRPRLRIAAGAAVGRNCCIATSIVGCSSLEGVSVCSTCGFLWIAWLASWSAVAWPDLREAVAGDTRRNPLIGE